MRALFAILLLPEGWGRLSDFAVTLALAAPAVVALAVDAALRRDAGRRAPRTPRAGGR